MTPEQTARAAELLAQRNYADGVLLANEALSVACDDADALFVAGQCFLMSGRHGLGQAFFARAALLRPEQPQVWHQLGACLIGDAQIAAARRCFERTLALDPSEAKAMANLSALAMQEGDPRTALEWADRALAVKPGFADALYNAGTAHLLVGDWGRGWDGFDHGLDREARTMRRAYDEQGGPPDWDGSPGQRVIVYGEQGIGDEVMLASMLPDLLRDSREVVLECDRRLEGLFGRSFSGLEIHGTRFEREPEWVKGRRFDARIALASLGRFYRRDAASFSGAPHLVADPERRLQWRALLDSLPGRLKVGIAWTGGRQDAGEAARSVALADLLLILRSSDVDFVSLQYRDPADEIAALTRETGITVRHWPRATEAADYDETAALVAELDLVIAVMTSACHLAGALGVECWTLVPRVSNWRWGLDGETTPWAKSIRIFRQGANWPIAEIASELRRKLDACPTP